MNPSEQLLALENKALCDVYFPQMSFPDVYVRSLNGSFFDREMNYISKEEAKRILIEKENFVIKPSLCTNQGFGVKKVSMCSDSKELDAIFEDEGKDFIAQ